MPILSELKEIWSLEIGETLQQRFPKVYNHEGSFNTQFTMTHYIVERWREGLLFSWIVGKIGGDDDEWDLAAALEDLGSAERDDQLVVEGFTRDTLAELENVFKDGGYDEGQTTYSYC